MTPEVGDDAFARGMFVALWPKVDKCESYVAELLAAQAQLQETIDQLLAGTIAERIARSLSRHAAHRRGGRQV